MESTWLVSLVVLWGVVLVNLLLTLRVVSFLVPLVGEPKKDTPELLTGAPAPDFKIKALSGEPVRLSDYAGREVVLIFVSPRCGKCRQEIPTLVGLGASAKQQGVELLLISAQGAAETQTWIDKIREEDKLEVNLPVLVAPRSTSAEFLSTYNPRGIMPYFCHINERGILAARAPLGKKGAWPALKAEWQTSSMATPINRSSDRYT